MMFLLALPNWLKVALASVAVLGVLQVQHWWQVRGLNSQIEELTVALAIEKGATAELRIGVADVSANRDTLESRIREQSQTIALLSARASAADARSRAAAITVAAATAVESSELRSTATRIPPGYAEMNRWLAEQFP